MQHHYTNIAEDFDHLWLFSPSYEDWMVKQIIEQLNLSSTDKLLDFGAGTGRFTLALYQQAKLVQATAVEPDADMCRQAAQKSELSVIQADDASLFSHWQDHNVVLFKEVIHHLHHRVEFWKSLHEHLLTSGRVLIVTRPQATQLALFDAAKQRFAQHQPPVELLTNELTEAGFTCDVTLRVFPFRISKQRWYTMLRSRFMSDLSAFSDDEVEQGIQQLETLAKGDFIDMHDNLLFIVARKQSKTL
jgi:ubiquinone/menaquinone biosynthesis C-methylase UbiE